MRRSHLFVAIIALLGSTEASATALLLNLRDPTYSIPTKEVRYQNLANQSRFDAIGSLNIGFVSGERQGLCSGTLIGPNTVLTSAHCVFNSTANRPMSRDELQALSFTFGPNPNAATETLRVSNYYVADQAGFVNKTNNSKDYALLQVYREGPGGAILPSTITPMAVYSGTDEATQLASQYGVTAGYGVVGYNQPGTIDRNDHLKRAGLVDQLAGIGSVVPGNGSSLDGVSYLFTEFKGGAELSRSGINPSTFLEGAVSFGDSGGALMMRGADGNMEVVGVNAFVCSLACQGNPAFVKEQYWTDNFPSDGGSISGFVRASTIYSDIQSHLFGVPSPENTWPATLPAEEKYLELIAASEVKLGLDVSPSTAPESWGFDYKFADGSGTISVYVGSKLVYTTDSASGIFGHAAFSIDGLDLWNSYLDGSTVLPATASIPVYLVFDALTGQRLFIDNIDFRSNFNGDFGDGLLGYTLDNPSHFSLLSGSLADLTVPGSVPEPTTWALMLLGFGAMGLAIRRSRGPAKLGHTRKLACN